MQRSGIQLSIVDAETAGLILLSYQHYWATPSFTSGFYYSFCQQALYLAFHLLLFMGSQTIGDFLMGRVPSWTGMLCCTRSVFSHILVILTEHSLVSCEQLCQPTYLFLGDSILVGFLKHSLQVILNLGSCWGASFKPGCLSLSILCYVLFINTVQSSNSEICCQLQRLVGGLMLRTIPLPLAPGRLMLFASTTYSVRPSINLLEHGCVMSDDRRVESLYAEE